jgi:hypothetical protein
MQPNAILIRQNCIVAKSGCYMQHLTGGREKMAHGRGGSDAGGRWPMGTRQWCGVVAKQGGWRVGWPGKKRARPNE